MSLEILRQNFRHIKDAIAPEPNKLRFIDWFLLHRCNLRCDFCRVPGFPVIEMNADQRQEALARLQQISIPGAALNIAGGEPMLTPELVVNAVNDATQAGFFVNLITNGILLTPDLIFKLGRAGLMYLGISIDPYHGDEEQKQSRAFDLLQKARDHGIVPVVNAIITRSTDTEKYKQFTDNVLRRGLFLSPIVCSPRVPNGRFSNASFDAVPTSGQLKKLLPWLAWKKFTTGRIATSFSYLQTMLELGEDANSQRQLWHCAPHFRSLRSPGRGYIALDPDGFAGPCQEFPRVTNLLDIPSSALSLRALDPQFSRLTESCPGCFHSCFITEEQIIGLSALAELPRGIQMSRVLSRRP